jgi:hypothetical protein
MKHNYKTILKALVIFIIGVWILSKMPFNKTINQEISVHVYESGVVTGETKVVIDGERSHYLFTDNERFHGKFYILSYEKTGRENMLASVKWNNNDHIQRLLYFQNGTFPSMDIVSTLIINDKMTQFALMFTDGTVIATSDEIYQIYTKHISYDSDTEVTSIEAVNEIPKI